ncbi:MAG TPA: substrate-binding domain-containing protein [Treponemataceae bacterium]|nr:substrate-binding domain-containing protein [Treponemataceae bacterium]
MKKITAVAAVLLASAMIFAGGKKDAANEEITVISREDGSGTRGAFIELLGVEQKDSSGNKVDYTTETASISNSTSVVMTSVAQNSSAIGYISLGSLNSTVKALSIDGAEPTVANIKSDAYKIARPFNIATKGVVSDVTQDFINYILSIEGQKVVESKGYIAVETKGSFTGTKPAGKIVVAGSSSVTPVMEKLKEEYLKLNPNAQIEVMLSDSTTGMNSAIEGICDIGMASRAVKSSELDKGLTAIVIAIDGIAIIVNKDSPVNALTSAQVRDIYMGKITTWSQIPN